MRVSSQASCSQSMPAAVLLINANIDKAEIEQWSRQCVSLVAIITPRQVVCLRNKSKSVGVL